MRRAGGLWPRVVAFDALCAAAQRASLGKRRSRSVARFLDRLEPEALALQRELIDGTWRPSPAPTFEIHDPKTRTITAVPFRDQVVHHALIAVLEPVFERRMLPDSFACRRGKGSHAALRRAQGYVRRFGWFLKADVRSFFGSLDHDVVVQTLSRVVRDRRVLEVCDVIVREGPCTTDGRGLPLGSLTSQWFANLALDRLDHHVRESLRLRGYLRYMDDFVLFADHRARLRDALTDVRTFLRDELHLRLKDRATILAPCTEGLPFLGWMVHRGALRLRAENARRSAWRLRLRRWETETGRRPETSAVAGAASVYAALAHGSTRGLRRTWVRRDDFDP